ncbi:MAG: hypothetical protein Tsb0027_04810 [Wenzhouxiangellaceae bacterium]
MTAAEMADMGNALLALPVVEYALMRPLYPKSPPSPTPDFSPLQDYRTPDPGADFAFAHDLGLSGQGIRLTEVSITWDELHEDLINEVSLEAGLPIDALIGFGVFDSFDAWKNHGTATLGMVLSGSNGFGTTGMAWGAEGYLYPTWVRTAQNPTQQRFEEALCNALADSALTAPGMVVYLEHQTSNFEPRETEMPTWDLFRMGTDAGVVVLAVAGNGDLDLDSGAFSIWRSWGDSGAIMVGAGSADSLHNRMLYPSFGQGSNYGSRVDVQGWGERVVTTGSNGDLATVDGDIHRKYTQSFSGTSSATPMIAAGAVLLQQYATLQGFDALDSRDMRSLLTHTGITQGVQVAGEIGPFIDVRSAIENFDDSDVLVDLQTNGELVSAIIDNAGPRIARDIAADISVTAGSPFNMSVASLPVQCVEVPLPPGTQCTNVCPIDFHCVIDAMEVGQFTALVLDFSNNEQGYPNNINISVSATSSSTSLDDENLTNNTEAISIGGASMH